MIVDAVSPTPFALLRRAKNFQYRDEDEVLQHFSDYDDPVQALTDECQRVLKCISSANDSSISNSKTSTGLLDTSWSRFEDVGFSGLNDDSDHDEEPNRSALGQKRQVPQGLRTTPFSKTNLGRPTTPSWADFLSSGFVDESGMQGSGALLLPPGKFLPPIDTRGKSSQSHRRPPVDDSELEPGELASITSLDLDDSFWWVWITSLAGEEPIERKAVFGRCALVETNIKGGRWLVMEEIVKGAALEPEAGAYIAEKKSRFGFSTRSRLKRSKSSGRKQPAPKTEPYQRSNQVSPMSKTSIAPNQHARIQAAAAALQQKHQLQDAESASPRRGRHGDTISMKTSSVFTLQPVILSEAAPAMKWANSYDKRAIRAAYLGNNFAGRGSAPDLLNTNGSTTPMQANNSELPRNQSYGFPRTESDIPRETTETKRSQERDLPALPPDNSKPSAPTLVEDESSLSANIPAPLPATPTTDLHLANCNAVEAAEVPLPSTTPNEHSKAIERKPLPTMQPQQTHTPIQVSDTFTLGPEYSDQVVPNGYSTTESSPESKRSERKKLKKKGNAGGFKGLFGKKKLETSSSPSLNPPSSDKTAVAAARAALQGVQRPEQTENHFDTSQPRKINRRFSSAGRKNLQTGIPIPMQKQDESLSSHDTVEKPAVSPLEPTPIPSPSYPPQDDYTYSQASLSRVDTNEQQHAEHEFRNFDQGPLENQPSFVPEGSPSRVSSEVDESVEHGGAYEMNKSEHMEDASGPPELTRQISPVQDRWAQIRKNAAERAARQSEEQSKQTDKTDDGETSGEESK